MLFFFFWGEVGVGKEIQKMLSIENSTLENLKQTALVLRSFLIRIATLSCSLLSLSISLSISLALSTFLDSHFCLHIYNTSFHCCVT